MKKWMFNVRTPNMVNKYNESYSKEIVYKQSMSGKETRNTPQNKISDYPKEDWCSLSNFCREKDVIYGYKVTSERKNY